MSERPKALFLAAESPYPLVGGGALRSASVLEYLFSRYETDVVCFVQPDVWMQSAGNSTPLGASGPDPSDDPRRRARSWTEIRLPIHNKSAIGRGVRNASRLLRGIPPLVDRFLGFHPAVQSAIRGQHYAVGVIEHFWCAPYAPVLRPHCERLVLDLHNVESLWHHRSARVAGFPAGVAHHRFASAAESLERSLLPQFDLILVTSQPECNSIAERLSGIPVAVVKNSIPYYAQPNAVRHDEVVFSGNMEYAPNQAAARHFTRKIWPLVTANRPGTRCKFIGKRAVDLERILETKPRVDFVTDPEDAMIEIAAASVAVVPLLVGTGTRLKIVESWACATPVVSTTVGAEGLDCEPGHDLLIEDEPEAFAKAVLRLLGDPTFAGEIGANGRKRFETAYTWQQAWDAMAACNL